MWIIKKNCIRRAVTWYCTRANRIVFLIFINRILLYRFRIWVENEHNVYCRSCRDDVRLLILFIFVSVYTARIARWYVQTSRYKYSSDRKFLLVGAGSGVRGGASYFEFLNRFPNYLITIKRTNRRRRSTRIFVMFCVWQDLDFLKLIMWSK